MKFNVSYDVVFGKPSPSRDEALTRLDLKLTERYIRLILRLFRDEFGASPP